MTTGNWFRVGAVVLLALTVQESLLIHLRVAGAHPDLMFLIPVVAGYVAGPGRGTVAGFGSGVVADLFVSTPFGMSALVGAVVAYCVAVATSSLVRSSVVLQIVTGAVGTAAGMCLYATLGAVLGFPTMLTLNLVPALVITAPVAAVLAPPSTYLMRWAFRPRASTERSAARSW